MRRQRHKAHAGFTMVEILIAVLIAAVLATIGVILIVQAVRRADMRKQDSYAEEVFIAAQNQMIELQSSGIWKDYYEDYEKNYLISTSSKYGEKMPAEPSDYTYVYSILNGLGTDALDNWNNTKKYMLYLDSANEAHEDILNTVLPEGSISSIRKTEGHYYIEYNIRTAKVYGVWYTDHLEKRTGPITMTYTHDIVQGVDVGGRPTDTITAAQAQNTRMNHRDKDGDTLYIGYYCAASLADIQGKLQNITVTVKNGEKLMIDVMNPNAASRLMYTITGLESGNVITGTITSAAQAAADGNAAIPYSKIQGNGFVSYNVTENQATKTTSIILDDIASLTAINNPAINLHFAHMFCHTDTSQSKCLKPGENVSVKVICYPTAMVGASVFKAATVNGLYEWADLKGSGSTTAYDVRISQIRHLENLNPQISESALNNINAMLVKDLTFNGVSENIYYESMKAAGMTLPAEARAEKVKNAEAPDSYTALQMGVNYKDLFITASETGNSLDGYSQGSYVPVSNVQLKSFTGEDRAEKHQVNVNDPKQYVVNNLSINTTAENVGMFGVINNVILSNFGITNYTISRNPTYLTPNAPYIPGCYYQSTCPGAGTVGAIAGKATNSTLSDVFANVKIVRVGGGGGDIGGLIGQADSSIISNCYVGGFTERGMYEVTDPNIAYSGTSAIINMGGLIGHMRNHSYLTNAYTAASVGPTTDFGASSSLGGIVGMNDDSSITNAYSAGPVFVVGVDLTGRFYGSIYGQNPGGTLTNVYYLEEFGIVGVDHSEEDLTNYSQSYDYMRAVPGASYVMTEHTFVEDPALSTTGTYPLKAYNNYLYPDLAGLEHYFGDWAETPNPGRPGEDPYYGPNKYYVRAYVLSYWVNANGEQIGANDWLDISVANIMNPNTFGGAGITGGSGFDPVTGKDRVVFNTDHWTGDTTDDCWYLDVYIDRNAHPEDSTVTKLIASADAKYYVYYDYGDNNTILPDTAIDPSMTQFEVIAVKLDYLQANALLFNGMSSREAVWGTTG